MAAETKGVKLTEAEREFIGDMLDAAPPREEPWQNFDPDFRQKDIARLIRRGWFERKSDDGCRQYRWTEAGRSALPSQPPSPQEESRGEG